MPAQEKTDLVWAPENNAVMDPDGFATRTVPQARQRQVSKRTITVTVLDCTP